jgi:hypothetical protein
VRYRRAREVQRAAGAVPHHFDHVWIVVIVALREGHTHRGHVEHRIRCERRDERLDGLRLDERLVALDVQDNLAGQPGGHLRNAIGPGAMGGLGHHRNSAEFLHSRRYSVVVSGDHDRPHSSRGRRAPINMFDHRFAADVRERFAGKTRGVVAGGDDGDDLWRGECSVERIRKSDRVHDES